MKTEQSIWTAENGWQPGPPGKLGKTAQLAVIFGSPSLLKKNELLDHIKTVYPNACLWGCSTAGEIYGTQVLDDSLVATIVEFEHTEVKIAQTRIEKMETRESGV